MLKTKIQNLNVQGQQPFMNKLLWLTAIALFGGGVVLNTLYVDISTPLRLVAWLVVALLCMGLLSLTTQGKDLQVFAKNSLAELARVVWPEKQETVQTTLIVMAMVVVVSIIIWIVDSGLLVLIGMLTGQRG